MLQLLIERGKDLHTIDNGANNLMDLAGLGSLGASEPRRKSRCKVLLHRSKRVTRSQWLAEGRGPESPGESATHTTVSFFRVTEDARDLS